MFEHKIKQLNVGKVIGAMVKLRSYKCLGEIIMSNLEITVVVS